MASIPLTESLVASADNDSSLWHVPGASQGVVEEVRRETGLYAGPELSREKDQEALILQEQLASGPRNFAFPWFLPYFDESSLGETEEMRLAYRRMLADPRIKTAMLGKLFGVARLNLRMLPADKKNKKDQEIAKHMEWMLTRRLRGGIPELAWSVLSGALIDGYSVCEKVNTLETKGKYAGTYSLSKLKQKDVNFDLILQTDPFRNVVGVMGLRFNGGREFSPSRFLIFRHLPLFDNPTGMSDFRSVYQSYWLLDSVTKLRAISAEKCAIPFLLGKYLNTTVKSSLEATLKKAKSQRWLSIPESCQIEVVNMAGASEDVFKSFVMDLRHDIFLGIQGAVLQTLEGETTDARGNSQVHQDTSDKFVWFLAQALQAAVNDEEHGLIKDYVDLNYVVSEYPQAVLDSVDVNELQSQTAIDGALHAIGLPLSKNELYERYERKPPEDGDDILAAGQPGKEGGQPSLSPSDTLPFADSMPPLEGEEEPFRGIGAEWRGYLAAPG